MIVRHDSLELDLIRLSVRVDGRVATLSGLQLKLLVYLVTHPDWVFSREQLLIEVWGRGADSKSPKTVDVLVSRLRANLGPAGSLIESVRCFGYRLRPAP